MLQSLIPYVHRAVVLATCNRTEIYTNVHNTDVAVEHMHRFLGEWSKLEEPELDSYLYTKAGWDAVRHLFRVNAGLDSMILGEEQILGQVRTAVRQAEQMQALDKTIATAFQYAQRTGRRVRVETAISRHAVSVSSVAVQLAKATFGSLDSLKALVISAGEAGKLASRSLVGQGVRDLLVTNRNYKRAEQLAEMMGGQAFPFQKLGEALSCADFVVSSTGSSHHVLTKVQLGEAMVRRAGRQLLLIDIAVPRDIDPEAAGIPGVRLFNLDDVQAFAQQNMDLRAQEVTQAEAIVEAEVQKFRYWWRTQEVIPTLTDLLVMAEDVRSQELQKTFKRLSLPEEDQDKIELMTKAIVKKLLHAPLTYLKEQGNGAESEALRTIFALKGSPAEPADDPPSH